MVAGAAAGLVTGCSGTSTMSDPATGEVTGTVTYRQRIALPPNAVIAVTLSDISRQDVPADVLAEAEIPSAGRQVPIPFRIAYPLGRIDPRHTYAVRARILVEGRMTMTSTTVIPVLTRGAPAQVEILVSPVGAPATPEVSEASGDDPG
jgi:putative lipoprotein